MDAPNVVILAGPNGAGKSTTAKKIVCDQLGIQNYVNADTLARGLAEFNSESMAFKAGRIMLEHLKELAEKRVDFAFETTLASKTFAPWIAELKTEGYHFHLIYLWLPEPEMSIRRVADRVSRGGHHVPDETVRRRYRLGLVNFFHLYSPIADAIRVFDNSDPKAPRLIAEKSGIMESIADPAAWNLMQLGAKP